MGNVSLSITKAETIRKPEQEQKPLHAPQAEEKSISPSEKLKKKILKTFAFLLSGFQYEFVELPGATKKVPLIWDESKNAPHVLYWTVLWAPEKKSNLKKWRFIKNL